MIKVTNINDKLALKVCLAITHKIVIEPGSVSARCRDAVLIVEQDHGIPAGRYTCRDYFLEPYAFTPARPELVPEQETEYVGQVPAAPAWQMQMALAELSGYVFSTRHLRALSVLYKGQPVTVRRGQAVLFLTIQNITLIVFPRVPTTRVLISGLPVTMHQALKGLADSRNTSVNKIILAAINREVRRERSTIQLKREALLVASSDS